MFSIIYQDYLISFENLIDTVWKWTQPHLLLKDRFIAWININNPCSRLEQKQHTWFGCAELALIQDQLSDPWSCMYHHLFPLALTYPNLKKKKKGYMPWHKIAYTCLPETIFPIKFNVSIHTLIYGSIYLLYFILILFTYYVPQSEYYKAI